MLKKGVILVVLLLGIAVPVTGQARPDYAGVWAIWGFDNYNTIDDPWLKGAMVVEQWKNLETGNNNWNWGALDNKINTAINNGYEYLMIKIYVGPYSPSWIYTSGGVPAVPTSPEGYYGQPYPYYLDDNYKTLMKRMIDKLREHIDSYPSDIRNRIVAVQAPIGRSGDESGYYGDPIDSQYDISDAQWEEYSKEMFRYYYNAFIDADPPIPLIFATKDKSLNDWLMQNTPHHWRKYAMGAHCYQPHIQPWDLVLDSSNYQSDGWALMLRDETDNNKYDVGIYAEAPLWYMYWTGLHALERGVDFWNIQYISKTNAPEFEPAYHFFNEYAGYHSASESHGAWIAFRDGLDYNNVVRWPESTYGTNHEWWTHSNTNLDEARARYSAIAQANSQFGAWQSPAYNPKFYTMSCELDEQNDVGWGILPGNYDMYIEQIRPLETSQGYWRVGPTTQRYGRFAKGFHNAAGKNTILLDIDDDFISNTDYTVTVTFYDEGSGRWALKYDADTGTKTAYTHTKTNTGRWQTRQVTLTDARFANNGPSGADIWLENSDSDDDIFHMVEIEKGDIAPCQDDDNDGYNAQSCGGPDCNDGDGNINPGADEICDNAVDEDCDGSLTNGCPVVTTLVAHWTFDGNSLDSAGSHHGDVTGATYTSAHESQGLSFDGSNDYVSVADSAALKLPGDFTISTWARFDTLVYGTADNTYRFPRILQKGSDMNQAQAWSIAIDTFSGSGFCANENRLYMTLRQGGQRYELCSTNQIYTNNWYHLVITRSGNTVRFYLNGDLDSSHTIGTGAFESYDEALFFGNDIGNTDGALDGILDDVRIYNGALTISEIQDMYSCTTITDLMNAMEQWKANALSISELLVVIQDWKRGC